MAVSAVGEPVLAGELVAGAAGVSALRGHHCDKGELTEVQLQVLDIGRLQLTSRTPGTVALLPVQPKRQREIESETDRQRVNRGWQQNDCV